LEPTTISAPSWPRLTRVSVLAERNELFNVASHGLGFLLSAVGLAFLLAPSIGRGDALTAASLGVYGAGLLAVFLASVAFHATAGRAKQIARRFDRSAIYVCMAATYTPVMVLLLPWSWSLPVLALVWAMATCGVLLEWGGARENPRHSVALYRLLGWVSLPLLYPIATRTDWTAIALIVGGGLLYSLGSIAVRLHKLHVNHQIWHVLVLGAAALHYAFMLVYVA
jgi:hemolysin III